MNTTTHHSNEATTANSTASRIAPPPPAGVSPADTGETIRQRINSAQTQIDAALKTAWMKLRARQRPAIDAPAVAVMPEGPLFQFA